MLEHDALTARLSLPHLLEYFTFQNIFTDGTLFAGVRLLPPGHHLTVRADGGPARSAAVLGLQLPRGDATAERPTSSTRRSSTACSVRPCVASS